MPSAPLRSAETRAAGKKAVITVESLIREAEEARAGAMADGQYAAAVAAIKEKGILSGKRIERSQVQTDHMSRMSTAEALAELAKIGVDVKFEITSNGRKEMRVIEHGASSRRRS
jgi:hypothetical protein